MTPSFPRNGVSGHAGAVQTDDLYDSYTEWFTETGSDAGTRTGDGFKPWSKNWFGRNLTKCDAAYSATKFTPAGGGEQVRGIEGIRLRDTADDKKAAKAAKKAASDAEAQDVFGAA